MLPTQCRGLLADGAPSSRAGVREPPAARCTAVRIPARDQRHSCPLGGRWRRDLDCTFCCDILSDFCNHFRRNPCHDFRSEFRRDYRRDFRRDQFGHALSSRAAVSRLGRGFAAAVLPRLFGKNPRSRAPPVGFELETNSFQIYAIANLDKTSLFRTLKKLDKFSLVFVEF